MSGPTARRRPPALVVRALRLSRAERALSLEALRALLRAFVLVRILGWSRYANSLGPPGPGDPPWTWEGDPATVRAVGRAVERWRPLAPRGATCLVRALAGRQLLARRGIPSRLVLGLRRDGGSQALGAHGWLRVGSEVIVGRREMAGHHAVAHFTCHGDGSPAG